MLPEIIVKRCDGILYLIRSCYDFIFDIWKYRGLLWSLTKKDIKKRYAGSYLGILWAFIQPTITIMIFWFVFQVGFKSKPVDNVPFVLWLICGMFPWFFFSDAIQNATNSICDNSFLVKKVVFRVSLLPIIQILSALVINIFFVVILFFMFTLYGFVPNVYNLQIVYYIFCSISFVFGLSLITSSLAVFIRDIGQAVAMLIQFGFWGTPIFWSLKSIPEYYHWIFKLNPMYYIIEGYRASFIYNTWFWERGYVNLVFWFFTVVFVFFGVAIYKKLRPHFADVL